MTERAPDDRLMVDYHLISELSRPDLRVQGNRDGSWTVDRTCQTCRVTVQLPHPQHAELNAFRTTVNQLGCFAGWQIPHGAYVTVAPDAGAWKVIDRYIAPDADFAPPGPRQPCPAVPS